MPRSGSNEPIDVAGDQVALERVSVLMAKPVDHHAVARDFLHLDLAVGVVEPGDPGITDCKLGRRNFAMLRVGPIDHGYFLMSAIRTRPHDLDRLTRDEKILAVGAGAGGDMGDRVDPILVLIDREAAQFLVNVIGLDRRA